MILSEGAFERIERKIAEIQDKIDQGIMDPGFDGEKAVNALRAARAQLFKLREILREGIEIESTRGPDGADAA